MQDYADEEEKLIKKILPDVKVMPKKITIKQDESCEMMEILIDGEYYAQGNYSDMDAGFWMKLIEKKFGVKIEHKEYKCQ
jgi:hypothetical protein